MTISKLEEAPFSIRVFCWCFITYLLKQHDFLCMNLTCRGLEDMKKHPPQICVIFFNRNKTFTLTSYNFCISTPILKHETTIQFITHRSSHPMAEIVGWSRNAHMNRTTYIDPVKIRVWWHSMMLKFTWFHKNHWYCRDYVQVVVCRCKRIPTTLSRSGFLFAPVTCQMTANHSQPLPPANQKTC